MEWYPEAVELYRKADLIEAEKNRRNNQHLRAMRRRQTSLYSSTAIRVGKTLSALGNTLQERYVDNLPDGDCQDADCLPDTP